MYTPIPISTNSNLPQIKRFQNQVSLPHHIITMDAQNNLGPLYDVPRDHQLSVLPHYHVLL